jgi:hypothetical protein
LVDKLSDVVWNEKAFDNLVLPSGEKELAWEFVESKAMSKSKKGFDDFVREKGRFFGIFAPCGNREGPGH